MLDLINNILSFFIACIGVCSLFSHSPVLNNGEPYSCEDGGGN
jgi:hypothetical protein